MKLRFLVDLRCVECSQVETVFCRLETGNDGLGLWVGGREVLRIRSDGTLFLTQMLPPDMGLQLDASGAIVVR